MTTQEFISKELEVRVKLASNENFIKSCIKVAKVLGISANEWNENKTTLLLFFANEAISVFNIKNDNTLNEYIAKLN